jgi:hypothetical protein
LAMVIPAGLMEAPVTISFYLFIVCETGAEGKCRQ